MTTLNLKVYGRITQESVNQLLAQLEAAPNADKIVINMHTDGGAVTPAILAYNKLKEHPGHKVIKVDGLVASAGTLIAAAGDEIHMPENTVLMAHPARIVGGVLTLADMAQATERLTKTNEAMNSVYATRTGKTVEEITAFLSKGDRWLTPKEAVAHGFATHVISTKSQVVATVDLSDYQNVPDWVMATLPLASTEDDSETDIEPPPAKPKAKSKATVEASAEDDIRSEAEILADERKRASAIIAKCALAGCEDRATGFITAGLSVEAVADRLLPIVCERHKTVGKESGTSDDDVTATTKEDEVILAEYNAAKGAYLKNGVTFEKFKALKKMEEQGIS